MQMCIISIAFEALLFLVESSIFIVVWSVFSREHRSSHYNYSALSDFYCFFDDFCCLENSLSKSVHFFQRRANAIFYDTFEPLTRRNLRFRLKMKSSKRKTNYTFQTLTSVETCIYKASERFLKVGTLDFPRAKTILKLTPKRP